MNAEDAYQRFLCGDGKAFEEIVNEYRYPLTYFIAGIVQDAAAAEDIAADVFAHLLIKKTAFGFRSSLKTYLFAIAKNKAADWFRKNKNLTDLPENLAETAMLEEKVFQDEKHRQITACLKRLKPDYRNVLILLYFENMSYRQAARVLKKNLKQIDNLAARAKQAIKKELKKEGIEHA